MKARHANKDVFLICRFDEQFNLLFQATIFAIMDCGFRSRCALEECGVQGTRIDKIMKLIDHCQYCVADISLGDSRDPDKPRLNMSMELGAFYHSMMYGPSRTRRKSLFVMDSEKFLYQQTISNLNGVDINAHANDYRLVIRGIRKWLASLRLPGQYVPPAPNIRNRFELFLADLPETMRVLDFDPNEPFNIDDYNEFVEIVGDWLVSHDRKTPGVGEARSR